MCSQQLSLGASVDAVIHLAGVTWWTVCSLPIPLLVCAGILWAWAWNTKSKGLALVAALFAIPVIAGIPYTWVFTKDVYTVNLSAASPLFAVLVGVALPGLVLLFGACAISFHDWKRDGSKDTRMSLINEPAVAQ